MEQKTSGLVEELDDNDKIAYNVAPTINSRDISPLEIWRMKSIFWANLFRKGFMEKVRKIDTVKDLNRRE